MTDSTEWDKIEAHLFHGTTEVFMRLLRLSDREEPEWGEFIADCKARYEKGREQHAGTSSTWEDWSRGQFSRNIDEEIIDAVIYAAAQRGRILDRSC